MRPGGALTVIHRADRLGDLLASLGRGFGAITVLPIHPKRNRQAKRVIVRGILGSNERLTLLPGFCLHEDDGAFTAAAEAILRDGKDLSLAADS